MHAQISRQKLPGDWHKRVAAINQKAVEAVKETPAAVLSGLPGGPDVPIDYHRAVQIRDKLLVGAEKTLFGGLTGPAALWDKICKAYENKCMFTCRQHQHQRWATASADLHSNLRNARCMSKT